MWKTLKKKNNKQLVLLLLIKVFHNQRKLMVFHWRFEWQQVSSSLQDSSQYSGRFSIMLLFGWSPTRSPTSKSFRTFNNSLLTVPKAPITVGIIVTLMFHSFFNSLARSRRLLSLFTFFQFYSVVSRDSKINNFADFLFLLIIMRSGLLAKVQVICLYIKVP